MFEEALLDIESVGMGVDPFRRETLVKLAAEQRNSYTAEDIRLAAALGKTAFEVTGETGTAPHALFSQLLKDPAATPGNRKIASVVFMSMGRVVRHEKQSFARAATVVKNTLGAATSAFPEVVKGLGVASMAAGAVGGGGLWAANRALTGEDQKLREAEIQRDTYSRLASEVKAELARRKMVNTPANVAAAVDYLT